MTQRTSVAVIGGGHNGLVCAAYLARAGLDVTLLEARDVLGGACVTEELWPGYRISRAAYVLSLFRPRIARELELERHGLVLLPRRPSSFTPLPDGRSLVLGADRAQNDGEIRKFSARDADAFPRYEALLERVADALEPTLDVPPPDPRIRRPADLKPWGALGRAALKLGAVAPSAARLLLGPARDLLEEWFDSEPLRSTLATDAVIGAFASPSTPGTGYVLFHHVMGSISGERGVWAYVRGGMGGLSSALAASARSHGAALRTGTRVAAIRRHDGGLRVALTSGEELSVDAVASCADPAVSLSLLEDPPESFSRALGTIDYRSPVVKLNLALGRLPEFRTTDRPAGEPHPLSEEPHPLSEEPSPLVGTIHLGALDLDSLDRAYQDAANGRVSEQPVVELTIPSTVDDSLAPAGKHVASIFAQYAPALPADDARWPELRDQMRDRVLAVCEAAAPGFTASVEHIEVLAPPDLQDTFGLTGGNIFHGAMTPDRLLFMRPVPGWAHYRTPVPGFYLCGSGTHPGGGVMGAPGRNAALEILRDL